MFGGAIDITLGTNTVTNNTIVENTANSEGGGLYLNDGLNFFANNILWDNRKEISSIRWFCYSAWH